MVGFIALMATFPAAMPVSAQADDFILNFDGPTVISGSEGQYVEIQCFLTLTHSGSDNGAQGWSVSMAARGADAEIVDITVDDTDAALLIDSGFERSELALCQDTGQECVIGEQGAVSAVVLSFIRPVVLPSNATSTVAKITLRARIQNGEEITLSYVDGLRGAGQPVSNNITHQGASVTPIREEHAISFCYYLDADSDGVIDCVDACPATPKGAIVYPNGCMKGDIDNDGDVDGDDLADFSHNFGL